jgi:hypothetical protein
MNARTATTLGAATALLVTAAVAPSALSAPKPKPKPKPIVGSYQATATPDPTPIALTGPCEPTLPGAMHRHEFKVPAKGTLFVNLENTLDWAVAIRTTDGETLAAEDGGTPEVKESTSAGFKKKQTVYIDACNFAGEPAVTVNYRFVYK